jgi:hypothetical protein
MKVKENTHIILKREDVEKYSREEQKYALANIINDIEIGRMNEGKKLNSYIICNTDEKYFNDMYAVLKAGEEAKERGEEYKSILPEAGPLELYEVDNDYWFLAYSEKEAEYLYFKYIQEMEEQRGEVVVKLVNENELDDLTYVDGDDNQMSYRERLDKVEKVPGFFARTID